MTETVFVFRDDRFGKDSVVTIANIDLVDSIFGKGSPMREDAVAAIFGGAAVFKNHAGGLLIGVWGARKGSRFRTMLRKKANIEVVHRTPSGRLVYYSKRPTRKWRLSTTKRPAPSRTSRRRFFIT